MNKVIKEKKVEFTSIGAKLKGFVRIPGNNFPLPGIILCHGFTNSKTADPLIQNSADALNRLGYATLQFDFYGSGESEGIFREKKISILRKNLEDAMQLFINLPEIHNSNIGLWGRSIGGTIAFLGSLHPNVKAAFLASPTVRFQEFFSKFISNSNHDFVSMPDYIEHGLIKGEWSLNSGFFEELNLLDTEVQDLAAEALNICIVQGTNDSKSKPQNTRWFYDLLPKPKRLVMFDSDHNFKGVQLAVLSEMIHWFQTHLK